MMLPLVSACRRLLLRSLVCSACAPPARAASCDAINLINRCFSMDIARSRSIVSFHTQWRCQA